MGTRNVLQSSGPTEFVIYHWSFLIAYIRSSFSLIQCTACGHSHLIIVNFIIILFLSLFFFILSLILSVLLHRNPFAFPSLLHQFLQIPLRPIPISCPIYAAISPIPIFPAPISTAYPNSDPAWILFSSPSRRPSVDRQ